MITPNTAQIRKKLEMAFDDSALSAFCFDYFSKVHDSFSQGMRKDDKITLLLDYCRRHPIGFETLLDNLRKEYTYLAQSSNFHSKQLKPLIDALSVYIGSSPRVTTSSPMLTETVVMVVTEVVFDCFLELGVTNKIQKWLDGKSQRLAFQVAIARTCTRFASAHPQWTAQLFDEHFLRISAAPLLARCLTRVGPPKPTELVKAWFDHMNLPDATRQRYVTDLTLAASDFLRWLEAELRDQPEFQQLFDSREIDVIAVATTRTVEEIAALRVELTQMMALLAQQSQLQTQMEAMLNERVQRETLPQRDLLPPEVELRFPEELEVPRGVVTQRDKCYVVRDADAYLKHQVVKEGTLTTIRAPRQTGKTSLLVRGVDQARQNGANVVYLDLQSVDRNHFETSSSFLSYLAEYIVRKLQLDVDHVKQVWKNEQGPQDKLSFLLEDYILPQSDKPLMLAMDEVDRLLETNFHTDFFALVRAWHNKRAVVKQWNKLNIVLVISTDPYRLIANPNQSPFNVGLRLYLEDFTESQVRNLNQRHGSPVKEKEIPELMALLNGHPYLTRQALYTLATKSLSWANLKLMALTYHGPFGDHLQYYHRLLRDKPVLKAGLKQILNHNRCSDEMTFDGLRRVGLVRGTHHSCTCRCDLYRMYFENQF